MQDFCRFRQHISEISAEINFFEIPADLFTRFLEFLGRGGRTFLKQYLIIIILFQECVRRPTTIFVALVAARQVNASKRFRLSDFCSDGRSPDFEILLRCKGYVELLTALLYVVMGRSRCPEEQRSSPFPPPRHAPDQPRATAPP